DRLIADPLLCFCLDHLTAKEQQALQSDLELASRIQRGLLPDSTVRVGAWEASYRYEPLGPVSGDHCDLIPTDGGDLWFVLGDVAGKGVAASLLMSHLRAMFRALVPIGLPLHETMARASRVFCESTLPNLYATLVVGRAGADGSVELCNAGHPPVLVVDD